MRESTNQMLKSYCFELGEVKEAELPGRRVCVAGAPGGEHACRGLRWNIPVVSLGCFNLP